MKVAIVCAFDTYFNRAELLKEYYASKGFDVTVITSDFSHRNKEKYSSNLADIHINVRAYQKNLSIDRIRSHYEFSKKTKLELESLQPEYIHALIPANSLTKELAKYKKEHPKVQLFFDVIDLWPETMPINKLKGYFPFTLWKNIRDNYIEEADIVFTECHLFQEVLCKENNPKFKTLYWARKEECPLIRWKYKEDQLSFCYLGSMNNIIDTDLILNFLLECKKHKKTVLHIIGVGEAKTKFIEQLKSVNINVVDHNEIYSQNEKQEIFDLCDYGLNVMKPSVVVGLTMKSLDYMCAGLPLINTIQGDTKQFCIDKNIGFNLRQDTISEVVQSIVKETPEQLRTKRINIQKLYNEYFTKKSFFEELDEALKK